MVNTRTASTLNLSPETTANPDPVQPAGNYSLGSAPNPPVQVYRIVAAPEVDGGAGGGGRGGGGNHPQPPPGPQIGQNPPNPMNFSLTPGGANLGVLYYSAKKGYHHYTGATYKLED